MSSYCITQNYEIKKLLSSRINLNQEDIKSKFIDQAPRILYEGNEKNYFMENQLIHNNPDLPDERDLVVNEGNREWVDEVQQKNTIN